MNETWIKLIGASQQWCIFFNVLRSKNLLW